MKQSFFCLMCGAGLSTVEIQHSVDSVVTADEDGGPDRSQAFRMPALLEATCTQCHSEVTVNCEGGVRDDDRFILSMVTIGPEECNERTSKRPSAACIKAKGHTGPHADWKSICTVVKPGEKGHPYT